MTAVTSSLLVKVLNAALDLDLADLAAARAFLSSDEGNELLDGWLAAHLDDGEDGEQNG